MEYLIIWMMPSDHLRYNCVGKHGCSILDLADDTEFCIELFFSLFPTSPFGRNQGNLFNLPESRLKAIHPSR